MSQDIEQQLIAARTVTEMSGVISDLQAHQLKCWAAGLFKGRWEVTLPVVTESNGSKYQDTTIRYKVTKKPESKYLELLENSVKFLFGESWTVEITLYDKKTNVKGKTVTAPKRRAKSSDRKKGRKRKVDSR